MLTQVGLAVGVGGEGVVLVNKAGRYDPKYQYFNNELTIFRIDSNFQDRISASIP